MEKNWNEPDDAQKFSTSLRDITGDKSHIFHDPYTNETVDLNELARPGLSQFYARKGKSIKKYSDSEKIQLSDEIDKYFRNSKEYFAELEFLEKKERYDKFKNKTRTLRKGRGTAKPFKLLVEASEKNPELVCILLEEKFNNNLADFT